MKRKRQDDLANSELKTKHPRPSDPSSVSESVELPERPSAPLADNDEKRPAVSLERTNTLDDTDSKSILIGSYYENNGNGGYVTELFMDLTEGFECPICFGVLRRPVLIPEPCICESFCYNCLAQTNRTCPKCRTPFQLEELKVDEGKQREISRMTIRCRFPNTICNARFTLGKDEKNLKEHQKICPGENIICAECSTEMPRKLFEDHQLTCPYIICKYCNEKFLISEFLTFHSIGPYRCTNLVFCENRCSNNLLVKKQLDNHLLICPLASIRCVLCLLDVARKDWEEHTKDVNHLLNLQKSENVRLANELLEEKKRTQDLTQKLDSYSTPDQSNNRVPIIIKILLALAIFAMFGPGPTVLALVLMHYI